MSKAAASAAFIVLLAAAPSLSTAHSLTPAQDAHEWEVYTKGQALELRGAEDKLAFAEGRSKQIIAMEEARVDLYRQQLILNRWIGIAVAVVVGIAVLLSLVQAVVDAFKTKVPTSSIVINKDGVRISSSVMALFVLLAAIFFFHVYISDVYTIHEAETAAAAAPPRAAPTPTLASAQTASEAKATPP